MPSLKRFNIAPCLCKSSRILPNISCFHFFILVLIHSSVLNRCNVRLSVSTDQLAPLWWCLLILQRVLFERSLVCTVMCIRRHIICSIYRSFHHFLISQIFLAIHPKMSRTFLILITTEILIFLLIQFWFNSKLMLLSLLFKNRLFYKHTLFLFIN